jgi:hypothetical protein
VVLDQEPVNGSPGSAGDLLEQILERLHEAGPVRGARWRTVTEKLDETRQDQTKQGQTMTTPKQKEWKFSPSEVTMPLVEIAKCCWLRN